MQATLSGLVERLTSDQTHHIVYTLLSSRPCMTLLRLCGLADCGGRLGSVVRRLP